MTSLISFIEESQKKNIDNDGKDSNETTLPFGQLLVEIHVMQDGPSFHIPRDIYSWMEWWAALERLGLRPVNNEDNWIGDVGYGKPRFMEVSPY